MRGGALQESAELSGVLDVFDPRINVNTSSPFIENNELCPSWNSGPVDHVMIQGMPWIPQISTLITRECSVMDNLSPGSIKPIPTSFFSWVVASFHYDKRILKIEHSGTNLLRSAQDRSIGV